MAAPLGTHSLDVFLSQAKPTGKRQAFAETAASQPIQEKITKHPPRRYTCAAPACSACDMRNTTTAKTAMDPSTQNVNVRATLSLSRDVLEEAREATLCLAGHPARMTLTKLAEVARRPELRRLKDVYNDGEDFPPRDDDLRGGRPPCCLRCNMKTGQSDSSGRVDKAGTEAAEKQRLKRRLLTTILRHEAARKKKNKKPS